MPRHLAYADTVSLVWFLLDCFTHLTIELGYVYLALTTTAAKTPTFLGHIWREYGRADRRWVVRDVTVISIEIATVFIGMLRYFDNKTCYYKLIQLIRLLIFYYYYYYYYH